MKWFRYTLGNLGILFYLYWLWLVPCYDWILRSLDRKEMEFLVRDFQKLNFRGIVLVLRVCWTLFFSFMFDLTIFEFLRWIQLKLMKISEILTTLFSSEFCFFRKTTELFCRRFKRIFSIGSYDFWKGL